MRLKEIEKNKKKGRVIDQWRYTQTIANQEAVISYTRNKSKWSKSITTKPFYYLNYNLTSKKLQSNTQGLRNIFEKND
jgi:hypothetical protein